MTQDRRPLDGALRLVRALRRLKERMPFDEDQGETLDELFHRWSKLRAPHLDLAVREHDPRWAQSFEREKRDLQAALTREGLADIQHIGSTSIPPMPGKNIVDLAVTMSTPPGAGQQTARLVELGYEPCGPSPIHEFSWFWRIEADRQGAFVVHLCDQRNPYFAGVVNFRDFMRALPEERSRYAELKHELAAVPGQSWLEYSVCKGVLVRGIIQRANAWAAAQGVVR